jgi:hypothetical protein
MLAPARYDRGIGFLLAQDHGERDGSFEVCLEKRRVKTTQDKERSCTGCMALVDKRYSGYGVRRRVKKLEVEPNASQDGFPRRGGGALRYARTRPS